MKMRWYILVACMALCIPTGMFSQDQDEDLGETMFGIRFGYSLELPSQNFYNGRDFALFEAGHRLTYGAYLNVPVDKGVDFSPYFGFEHVFWPKSLGYSSECSLDSFPTFQATNDTIPGRDFRFYNLAFEPSFRFYISKLTIFLKLQPMISLNLRTRVENYVHECDGIPLGQTFLEFEETELRFMSRVNFGLGAGIVKEVPITKTSFLALEPGFKFNLTPLLRIRDQYPQGPSFSLYPWGFYVNLSFVR